MSREPMPGTPDFDRQPFKLDEDTAVIFIGGPENGRVIKGQDAFLWANHGVGPMDQESGELSFIMARAKVGRKMMMINSRWMEAMQLLGMDRANQLLAKHGVDATFYGGSKYELVEIDGDVFVYRYIGPVAPE